MNLWHLSHEGLDLEDPANEPQYNKPGFLELGVSPEMAPDKPTYITLHFEKGVPTALNGEEMDGVTLIKTLNKIGGGKRHRAFRPRGEPAGRDEVERGL